MMQMQQPSTFDDVLTALRGLQPHRLTRQQRAQGHLHAAGDDRA